MPRDSGPGVGQRQRVDPRRRARRRPRRRRTARSPARRSPRADRSRGRTASQSALLGNAARRGRLHRQHRGRRRRGRAACRRCRPRPRDQRQLGLGEQLEQHRAPGSTGGSRPPARPSRALRAIGARSSPSEVPRSARIASTQRGARAFGGQLAAVGPGAVAQAEDEAAAVVGDDPAVGERGNDLALGVERDQAGAGRGAQVLRAGRKPHAARRTGCSGVSMKATSTAPSSLRPQPASASAARRERRADSQAQHVMPARARPRRSAAFNARGASAVRSCAGGSGRPATPAPPGGCAV